ncbi:peptidoglycan/LPS O-acetylase OafA/YrhL [Micromonospora pisi]|uniref:Peptidoglycan/LPS O-acetylase OafA/YrhL n=1 Tax=Micromonospora pisi TaxID=589240 RepID=A0A495JIW6_9ACTN|nr:acyltransferase [Micromonospora pisi]RKR88873.1 peptidoglycan/LPS O-acetylase OafA/YrhL [Micromonospora pisi]
MNSTPSLYQERVRPDASQPHDEAAEQVGSDSARPARRATRTRSNDRLHVLDLLRFGAAMLVVGYHLLTPAKVWGTDTEALFTHPIRQFFHYGWIGVEFFFVISGFVICMSGWGRTLSEFFISRVTRLMPMYVMAVLLTSAVVVLGPAPENNLTVPGVLANLTMIQGLLGFPSVDTVYWTLIVELKFYLLFAIVVWFGVTYRRVLLFCAAWTIGGVFAEASETRLLQIIFEPMYTSYFVVGMTLYLMHRFGPSLLLWSTLGMSAILCSVSLVRRVDGKVTHYSVAFLLLMAFLLVMTGVALGWFSWIRWRGMVTIGLLTYPVYLLHQRIGQQVIHGLRDGGIPPWLLLGGVVVGVSLVAATLTIAYERPVSRLLRDRLRANFADVRLRSAGVEANPDERRRPVGPTRPGDTP